MDYGSSGDVFKKGRICALTLLLEDSSMLDVDYVSKLRQKLLEHACDGFFVFSEDSDDSSSNSDSVTEAGA